jgi:RNA polymerase sigma-70 factor, ECF subfamily
MEAVEQNVAGLLARVALRDRAAFTRLYSLTSAKLFGVVLRILRDRAEAEEALQEVYVRVWLRAGQYAAGRARPMTWLITIARNHAIDLVRMRAAQGADIEEAERIADPAPGPEAAAVLASERTRIDLCLGELETDRAGAVRAAYVEGYSYEELATRFGVPLNTMRTWLRRSLLRLRECLER